MDLKTSGYCRTILYISCVLCAFYFTTTSGKYISGSLTTRNDWEFLARFCFLSDRGRLRFEFEYPKEYYEPQNVLLYFDEAHQWDAVYKSGKSCLEKEAVLDPQNNQIINLTKWYRWSGCKESNISGIPWYRCVGGRSFKSSRERWWFIALSHCNSSVGLSMNYKLWMTNGETDDKFTYHFSADEFYILQVDIAFLCAFFCMFILSIICGYVLRNRQLFHTTYKIYMVSITAEVAYLLIACISYGKYSEDGMDNYNTKVLARVFEAASTLIFLLLLILMGKGFTITRGRISTSGSIKIAIFMTVYSITYIVLFIYEANFFDPGKVLYIYESPAGYGLIAMRIIGWAWFCYAIFFTLKHYPEKASFYYPFFIFYTIWFLIGPIFVLIAYYVIAKWAREKIVNGVTLCIAFCAHTFFLFLTRPTAANKNFPYHVRTSQIGVLNTGPPQNGNGSYAMSDDTESFPHHTYAAAPPEYDSGPNFSDVFTVSNTRSNGNNNKGGYSMHPNMDTNGTNLYNTTSMQQMNGNAAGNGAVNPDSFPHQKAGDDPFVVQR